MNTITREQQIANWKLCEVYNYHFDADIKCPHCKNIGLDCVKGIWNCPNCKGLSCPEFPERK